MGIVRPWRSQALYHGVAAALTPESDPAILLVRTNRAYLCVGQDDATVPAASLAYCREQEMPVIARQVSGPPELIDQHQLGFQLIVHLDRLEEMGLADPDERCAKLASPLLTAYNKLGVEATFHAPAEIRIGGKRTGGLGWGQIEAGLALTGSMVLSAENDLRASVLTGDSGNLQAKVAESLDAYTTTLEQEATPPPRVENLAARLVDALEQQWQLDVYPAFPTLEELEIIEEYDEYLQVDLSDADGAAPAGALQTVYIRDDVQVLHAAAGAEGNLEAVIRVVAGQLDSMLLSGDLQAASKTELAALADMFAGAGLDSGDLQARFKLLRDAESLDQDPVGPPLNIAAATT